MHVFRQRPFIPLVGLTGDSPKTAQYGPFLSGLLKGEVLAVCTEYEGAWQGAQDGQMRSRLTFHFHGSLKRFMK